MKPSAYKYSNTKPDKPKVTQLHKNAITSNQMTFEPFEHLFESPISQLVTAIYVKR